MLSSFFTKLHKGFYLILVEGVNVGHWGELTNPKVLGTMITILPVDVS